MCHIQQRCCVVGGLHDFVDSVAITPRQLLVHQQRPEMPREAWQRAARDAPEQRGLAAAVVAEEAVAVAADQLEGLA